MKPTPSCEWLDIADWLPEVQQVSSTGLYVSQELLLYNKRNNDTFVGQLCVGADKKRWWLVFHGITETQTIQFEYVTHWLQFPPYRNVGGC